MSGSDSRLSRWSRLKSEARQQSRIRFAVPDAEEAIATVEQAEVTADEPDGVTAEHRDEDLDQHSGLETSTDQVGAEVEEGPELPDLETLDSTSDYTPFMSDKVSDSVRNLALRKLWLSDSVFANLDGLIDYGEDFTDAATVVEGMKSVYTVGRGMVDYEAEAAAKRAAEAAEEADSAALEEGVEGEAEAVPDSELSEEDSDGNAASEVDVEDQKFDPTHSNKEEKREFMGGTVVEERQPTPSAT
ncbi:DUF3306 domain-containing protein [Hwanghaeella sp.]|uniref:DUF3306 domain-containing protein n=1 Tax=Hwanghaeella sp. TaxID=2605943 RepID=UPI003CCBBE3C